MSQDWAAVGEAINERVTELGWRQRELAQRSRVSQATVREIQHHTIERRRSTRTLESLSTALGLHPRHLNAVLHQQRPPAADDPIEHDADTLSARLDAVQLQMADVLERLDAMHAELSAVAKQVGLDG